MFDLGLTTLGYIRKEHRSFLNEEVQWMAEGINDSSLILYVRLADSGCSGRGVALQTGPACLHEVAGSKWTES